MCKEYTPTSSQYAKTGEINNGELQGSGFGFFLSCLVHGLGFFKLQGSGFGFFL
jgi:hypothetical protein